jgi:hypothetical protein
MLEATVMLSMLLQRHGPIHADCPRRSGIFHLAADITSRMAMRREREIYI